VLLAGADDLNPCHTTGQIIQAGDVTMTETDESDTDVGQMDLPVSCDLHNPSSARGAVKVLARRGNPRLP
jgi:hypothetical protein